MPQIGAALWLVLSLSAGPAAAGAQGPVRLVPVDDLAGVEFRHVYGGAEKVLITEMAGSGGAWIDYDADGRLDLFLVNGLPGPPDDPPAGAVMAGDADGDATTADPALGHRLFRAGEGRFADATRTAGVGDRVWGNGAAVGDVDNDGFPDLYVAAIGPNRLYRNNGDGSFSPWPSGAEDPRWGTSAAFVDWDLDGNLDLYVANYIDFDAEPIPPLGSGTCFYRGIEVMCGPEGLAGERDAFFRNQGDGSFVAWPSVEVDPEATYGFAVLASDCDADGRPDIYVATDSTINLLYRRDDEGGLDDVSLFSGAGYSGDGREQAGMGVTAADFDADGDLDLYVTNFQHDYNNLYRNLGGCFFEDVSERLGIALPTMPYMGWAALFLDVDGDGDRDLYVANGHIYPQLQEAGLEDYEQRNLLFLNRLVESGSPGFDESGEGGGPGMAVREPSRAAILGDWDDDGDADLLVTNIGRAPTLLRNDTAALHPALSLTLIGRRANRDAYGAVVRVESGGRLQLLEARASDGYLGSNDPRLLVHLPGGVADRVEIVWPGGGSTRLEQLLPGRVVVDEARGIVGRREW